MEDILASIRRILAEDEPPPGTAADTIAANGTAQPALKDDVLVLDSSMLAPATPAPAAAEPAPQPAAVEVAVAAPSVTPVAVAAAAPMAAAAPVAIQVPPGEPAPLVLRNTLPCFEDAVRAAMQPVVQQWVDAALPKLVERLVRTEVERVVGGVVT